MAGAAVFVKGATFKEVQDVVSAVLEEVDEGVHDAALTAAGQARPAGAVFKSGVRLSHDQGVSTQQWVELAIDYAPVVAPIGEAVWELIVLPRLRRFFHEDRVSKPDPRKRRRRRS